MDGPHKDVCMCVHVCVCTCLTSGTHALDSVPPRKAALDSVASSLAMPVLVSGGAGGRVVSMLPPTCLWHSALLRTPVMSLGGAEGMVKGPQQLRGPGSAYVRHHKPAQRCPYLF